MNIEEIRKRHEDYIERGEPDDWLIHKDRGELLKKVEELEARLQWQPIETVPMDGTLHVRGLWVHKHNAGYEWQQFVGYIDDDGDFVDDYGDSHTGWDTEDFSHWMPLPEPPEAIKGEGDG